MRLKYISRKIIFSLLLIIAPCILPYVHGSDGTGFNTMGLRCYEKGDLVEAEKYYLMAIACDPTVKQYYNNLAVVYMNQGRYEKAIPCLEVCIAMDPCYVKALSNLAVCSAYTLDFSGAYRFYRRAMQADSAYTSKKFEMSRVRSRMADLQNRYPDNRNIRIIMHRLNDADVKK